jgi:hypothetical protein
MPLELAEPLDLGRVDRHEALAAFRDPEGRAFAVLTPLRPVWCKAIFGSFSSNVSVASGSTSVRRRATASPMIRPR